MAVETNADTARLWSFSKPVKVATYVKAKVAGFYINGESVVEFPESNSNMTENFIAFLRKIREANPEKRIVIVLDNFKTHRAKKVREEAEKLNLVLVYLPPYSPDLNPIEKYLEEC